MSLGWSILLNGSFHDFRLQILSRTMRPLCHGKIQRPQENPQQAAAEPKRIRRQRRRRIRHKLLTVVSEF